MSSVPQPFLEGEKSKNYNVKVRSLLMTLLPILPYSFTLILQTIHLLSILMKFIHDAFLAKLIASFNLCP